MERILVVVLLLLGQVMASDAIVYHGGLHVIKKVALAKDMLNILGTVFGNAKYWAFKDIKEEDHSEGAAVIKGMYVTDIEVTHFEYRPEGLYNSLIPNSEQKRVTLRTKEPLVKYTFHFKWKAEASNIHLAYGSGVATMTSTDFEAYYDISNALMSKVDVVFNVDIISIIGTNFLTPNIKGWILSKLKQYTRDELNNAIKTHSYFLVTYLHSNVAHIDRRLNDYTMIDYATSPVNMTVVGNNILYNLKTRLYVNGTECGTVLNTTEVTAFSDNFDSAFYLSSQLIPLTLNVHGRYKKLDGEIDLRKLGLTGTVSDLFSAIPQLSDEYTGIESLALNCFYPEDGQGFDSLPEQWLILPLKCRFFLRQPETVLLSADIMLKLKYEVAITEDLLQLLVAKFSEGRLYRWVAKPSSLDVGLWLTRLFKIYSRVTFEAHVMDLPRLRFQPFRASQLFNVTHSKDGYVAMYADS